MIKLTTSHGQNVQESNNIPTPQYDETARIGFFGIALLLFWYTVC
jgi:hypothetical protein